MDRTKRSLEDQVGAHLVISPDILVAHSQKHHVYHLAAGCVRSGLKTLLLVPLYRKGLAACIANVPGRIGRRAGGA